MLKEPPARRGPEGRGRGRGELREWIQDVQGDRVWVHERGGWEVSGERDEGR